MQTVIVVLSPEKLANPDLDLRYLIPDRLEELSEGRIRDCGYDYIDREGAGPLLAIWLEAADANVAWEEVAAAFRQERFLDNDLAEAAEIYIAEAEAAELAECRRVYPA